MIHTKIINLCLIKAKQWDVLTVHISLSEQSQILPSLTYISVWWNDNVQLVSSSHQICRSTHHHHHHHMPLCWKCLKEYNSTDLYHLDIKYFCSHLSLLPSLQQYWTNNMSREGNRTWCFVLLVIKEQTRSTVTFILNLSWCLNDRKHRTTLPENRVWEFHEVANHASNWCWMNSQPRQIRKGKNEMMLVFKETLAVKL